MSYQSIYNDINNLLYVLKPLESSIIDVPFGYTFHITKTRNNYYITTYWQENDNPTTTCLNRNDTIKFILDILSIKPP